MHDFVPELILSNCKEDDIAAFSKMIRPSKRKMTEQSTSPDLAQKKVRHDEVTLASDSEEENL